VRALAAVLATGILCATPALASSEWAPRADDGTGYRANLAACVMGRTSCRRGMLREDDAEYLRTERGARTRDPVLARDIARARTARPVRIVVSEEHLDRLHRRDVEFERYRTTVRALRHGWVPGESAPFSQAPYAWAPSERRAYERDVARERTWVGTPY